MGLGLSPAVISWCQNYLNDRKQSVKINEIVSETASISYGVPQGSILGPLLYIIYVNDVFMQFSKDDPNILLYADDTVLYFAHEQLKRLECIISNGLRTLNDWCNLNKLTINISKTKYEIFKPKCFWNAINDKVVLKIGNTLIEEVDTYTYLGVKLDNRLKFDGFLKAKCNKINVRLHQLGKMRKYITNNIANLVYKQTIVPLYDYADFLIESGQNVLIERLDMLHSKALRMIDCATNKQAGDAQLEHIYGLLNLATRRHEHHCAVMYRLSQRRHNLDSYRPSIILRSRNKVRFRKLKFNLKGIEKSPMHRGIRLWDRIPQAVQRALTKVKFKLGLRKVQWE